MRLIDAEELKHRVNNSKYYGTERQRDFCDMIAESETKDAVEVVRCKDCKASRVYGKTTQWLACEDVMEGQATDPDGYCYLGERKEP